MELIRILCDHCQQMDVLQEPELDIAGYLREAVSFGWRNISVGRITVDTGVEIGLYGCCPDCTRAIIDRLKARRAA